MGGSLRRVPTQNNVPWHSRPAPGGCRQAGAGRADPVHTRDPRRSQGCDSPGPPARARVGDAARGMDRALGIRIVTAAELGDPGRLEALARRVFGDGDRPAGWFDRKLRREQVDLRLSPVAVAAGAEARDPDAWLGYVLVGTPGSLGDAVRTAGTGVVPRARGRGLGGRLLADAVERCASAGRRRMQILAEAEVTPFYARHGFSLVTPTVTALGFARGTAEPPPLEPPGPWRALERGEHEPVAWLPEAWEGTELAARHGLSWSSAWGPARAWLSREGVAWLVQRLVAPERGDALPALADALLRRLPAGAPVLLPLLPAEAPVTRELLASGWAPAQRGALLDRPL
jgi:GNAT superfamily N-acetyltransferase